MLIKTQIIEYQNNTSKITLNLDRKKSKILFISFHQEINIYVS